MEEPAQDFTIIYAPQVQEHIQAIERKYYSLIRDTIEEQLRREPDVETRNRKPLKRSVIFSATWELRFGLNNEFRAFYDIFLEEREVYILAIGVKRKNRLFLGEEEIEL